MIYSSTTVTIHYGIRDSCDSSVFTNSSLEEASSDTWNNERYHEEAGDRCASVTSSVCSSISNTSSTVNNKHNTTSAAQHQILPLNIIHRNSKENSVTNKLQKRHQNENYSPATTESSRRASDGELTVVRTQGTN